MSVIRLRSRLQELGVWSENDVYDFDVALRTRNEIARGDRNELSRGSITKAVETMQRLREKRETTRLQEGYSPTLTPAMKACHSALSFLVPP